MPRRLLDVKFCLQGCIREDKETGAFVSYCPALGLYSAGKTRIDAKNALRSALNMYIRICFERQILGRLLRDKGFEATFPHTLMGIVQADAPVTEDEEQFIAITVDGHEYDDVFPVEVPLHLIQQQQQQQQVGA